VLVQQARVLAVVLLLLLEELEPSRRCQMQAELGMTRLLLLQFQEMHHCQLRCSWQSDPVLVQWIVLDQSLC
jgi:hypothetical protein